MALKAVHVSDVPGLDHVPEGSPGGMVAIGNAACQPAPRRSGDGWLESGRLAVIGHRGKGMNALASADRRLKEFKENSILSFNEAARFPIDFVEFDVQVTKDGFPVVFHDNFILSEENGIMTERRVTELHLEEFLSYGPQKDPSKEGKPLHRKLKDGRIFSWATESDDSLCTLQEVFQQVDPRLGFNVELKFDDHVSYHEEDLKECLQQILRVIFEHSQDRLVIFSSFQPDAARLMRKLQSTYPVLFLTNGGNEVYSDYRRNSLDEALKWCLENELHGIVSEVRGVLRNPTLIPAIKESKLSLLTYGQLNNVAEAVYMQHLMGVDGVIVDLVEEITEAVSDLIAPVVRESSYDIQLLQAEGTAADARARPQFSQRELKFLLKLIPELVQH